MVYYDRGVPSRGQRTALGHWEDAARGWAACRADCGGDHTGSRLRDREPAFAVQRAHRLLRFHDHRRIGDPFASRRRDLRRPQFLRHLARAGGCGSLPPSPAAWQHRARAPETAGGRCVPAPVLLRCSWARGGSLRRSGQHFANVALVGLGSGGLACYAEPGSRWTFFEIDALVERIARDPALFTFLPNSRGQIAIAIGDGEKGLRRRCPAPTI